MKKPLNYYGYAFDDPSDSYNEDFLKTKAGKKQVAKERKSKKKLRTQIKERGFDDSECWNLDHTIVQFALPRIKRLKEITNGYPSDLTEEAWDEVLDKMIWSMEALIKDDTLDFFDLLDPAYSQRFQEGFTLFGKYFCNLWD